MNSHAINSKSLFHALEARGWIWEREHLNAPKGTFWIEGTRGQSTPLEMLLNIRESMTGALASLRASQPGHLNRKQQQDWVSDMESLVNTIDELLKNQIVE